MRYAVSGHPLPDFVAIAISLSSHSGYSAAPPIQKSKRAAYAPQDDE
jgi:hypothetical protein